MSFGNRSDALIELLEELTENDHHYVNKILRKRIGGQVVEAA